LHDNAPAHRALATQKKLACLGFQCLDHPPYSPDLAPSDYHLFPGLKKTIGREVGRAKDLSAPRVNIV
jgi:histone-lysine N-methyltransferase SETMAR